MTDAVNGRPATLLATIPNAATPAQGADGQVIQLSHQSDNLSDGKVLVITDEAGGGVPETGCNEDPSGKIGAAHFWNIEDLGAPRKLGSWLYPNPCLPVGMDVFLFTSCDGIGCVLRPTNTPGSAGGGGKLVGDLAEFTITRGTAVGGTGQFGLDVSYLPGAATPAGSLHFRDKATDVRVDATSIDSLTIAGPRATITGRATVNGTVGVAFFAEVEDLGKAGADTFRIVLGSGYGAFGVVDKGNITVTGGVGAPL